MGDSKLQKAMLGAAQVCMIQRLEVENDKANLFALHTPITANYEEHLPNFVVTLAIDDLFEEPAALRLSMGIFEHKILLIHGSAPVSIRPYRYPLK